MSRFKKGDPVIVIAGNDKGKEGTLEAIKGQKVIVKGVNKKKKHMKGDGQGRAGQIVEFEAPINVSNIAFCEGGKACKLRSRTNSDGKKEIFVTLAGSEEKVIRTI
ncbi:MAG: 50S ribosomal protein L24 [Chlamydiia bacterium]|nr:50S ribosomal protein L24 [Chlamydiia bacterium]